MKEEVGIRSKKSIYHLLGMKYDGNRMEIIQACSEKQGFSVSFHKACLRNQVELAVRSTMYYNLFQNTNPYFVLGLPTAGRYLVLGTILILLS
jgi:hypothetical protein